MNHAINKLISVKNTHNDYLIDPYKIEAWGDLTLSAEQLCHLYLQSNTADKLKIRAYIKNRNDSDLTYQVRTLISLAKYGTLLIESPIDFFRYISLAQCKVYSRFAAPYFTDRQEPIFTQLEKAGILHPGNELCIYIARKIFNLEQAYNTGIYPISENRPANPYTILYKKLCAKIGNLHQKIKTLEENSQELIKR